ncbi:hypothetical protein SAMN05216176_105255 [Nitratireductor indicus]|nr:hypothetical protein SAMN05216176_105255 [Nitratireductor indicus]
MTGSVKIAFMSNLCASGTQKACSGFQSLSSMANLNTPTIPSMSDTIQQPCNCNGITICTRGLPRSLVRRCSIQRTVRAQASNNTDSARCLVEVINLDD